MRMLARCILLDPFSNNLSLQGNFLLLIIIIITTLDVECFNYSTGCFTFYVMVVLRYNHSGIIITILDCWRI